mmetsp:Transcript_18698/g.29938  ORF Transcript_18698/g.29938 Transcript_18698/m.29938 type:complete len:205 (-) Transcript_18698:236-850(-)
MQAAVVATDVAIRTHCHHRGGPARPRGGKHVSCRESRLLRLATRCCGHARAAHHDWRREAHADGRARSRRGRGRSSGFTRGAHRGRPPRYVRNGSFLSRRVTIIPALLAAAGHRFRCLSGNGRRRRGIPWQSQPRRKAVAGGVGGAHAHVSGERIACREAVGALGVGRPRTPQTLRTSRGPSAPAGGDAGRITHGGMRLSARAH